VKIWINMGSAPIYPATGGGCFQRGVAGGGVIPSVGSAPSIGVECIRRLRELKTQEALYEQLAKQFEMAKIMNPRFIFNTGVR